MPATAFDAVPASKAKSLTMSGRLALNSPPSTGSASSMAGTIWRALPDDGCQGIALTLNTAPRKCLSYKTPIEAFPAELGKDVTIRFA
tara:strand:- start:32 stop:295 length:264 start_codon:yes stop_codon:yes gene_type:complete